LLETLYIFEFGDEMEQPLSQKVVAWVQLSNSGLNLLQEWDKFCIFEALADSEAFKVCARHYQWPVL
jgi:hypothetical protein